MVELPFCISMPQFIEIETIYLEPLVRSAARQVRRG
jgi:hypothetical protein